MRAALSVEWLKLRRSRIVPFVTVVLVMVPCLIARTFLWAAGRRGSTALDLKAAAIVRGDGWNGYFDALTQIVAVAGLLGMGIVVVWCFGREFAEGTVVSLYATAVGRARVAAGKLIVLALWCTLVSVGMGPAALVIGVVTGLGAPDDAALNAMSRIVVLTFLTGLLALTMAPVASLGRGYLAGVGGLVGVIVAAQITVVAGVGAWFPYAMPGLWSVSGAPGMPGVPDWHLGLVPLTTFVVGGATIVWWRRAVLA